jgi:hypothetical protein
VGKQTTIFDGQSNVVRTMAATESGCCSSGCGWVATLVADADRPLTCDVCRGTNDDVTRYEPTDQALCTVHAPRVGQGR